MVISRNKDGRLKPIADEPVMTGDRHRHPRAARSAWRAQLTERCWLERVKGTRHNRRWLVAEV
jgi:hypothetical protein